MKADGVYRARLVTAPIWPYRKGLRAPAVHNAPRLREESVGSMRGPGRAAQAVASLNRTAVH